MKLDCQLFFLFNLPGTKNERRGMHANKADSETIYQLRGSSGHQADKCDACHNHFSDGIRKMDAWYQLGGRKRLSWISQRPHTSFCWLSNHVLLFFIVTLFQSLLPSGKKTY